MTGRWAGGGRTDRTQHSTAAWRTAWTRGGASQIVVIGIIGIIGAAALLMMGFLTIPMIVGGSSLLFSAGTGGFGCSGSAEQAKNALQSKVSGQAKNSIPSNTHLVPEGRPAVRRAMGHPGRDRHGGKRQRPQQPARRAQRG